MLVRIFHGQPMVFGNVMQQTRLQLKLIGFALNCPRVLDAKGNNIVQSRGSKFLDCSIVNSHVLFFFLFLKFRFGARTRWIELWLLPLPSQSSFKIVVKFQYMPTNRLRTSSHKLVPKTKKTKQNKIRNIRKDMNKNKGED